MSIPVILNGAFGKMGQIAQQALEEDPRFTLIAKLGSKDSLKDSLLSHSRSVVVDLTTPEVVFQNAQEIIETGHSPMIGTTGLNDEECAHLKELAHSKAIGGLIAPNFSIGALLMMKFAKETAHYFPSAEIIEAHNPLKKDKPSGTALRTAKQLQQAESLENIPIHSIRLPGFVARQEVIFGGPGERLSIQHEALDRSCFMPGLLFACEKVFLLNNLVIGLETLLFDGPNAWESNNV